MAAANATALPAAVDFEPADLPPPPRLLEGTTIAIARDTAFAFIYPENLSLLEAMGARLKFFSPLSDNQLPAADALWLPGGYPELHLEQLAANGAMMTALKRHFDEDKPILAECGGMLYLLDRLTDKSGNSAAMAGLVPGSATLQAKLVGLGMQSVEFPAGELRGHAFHHSHMTSHIAPCCHAVKQRNGERGEAVYRLGSLTASYVHFYFPSNPQASAALFNRRSH